MFAMATKLGQPFTITLHEDSEKRIRAVASARHMSMRGLMSEIAEWFVTLDETEQSLVVGTVAPDDYLELLARALSRRAKKSIGAVTVSKMLESAAIRERRREGRKSQGEAG